MGKSCSSKEECSPKDTPLLRDPTASLSEIKMGGMKARKSDKILTTEDHHQESKSRVRRQLSASTLALKHLLSGVTPGNSKAPSVLDLEEEEAIEKAKESLEQLWEACYDLSELIEQTSDRVLRYHKEFKNTGYSDGDDNEKKVVDVTDSLSQDLKKLPFKDIVYDLQSVVFSTDDEGCVNSGYIEKIKSAGCDLSRTLNESYDLFLVSSKLDNNLLVERSVRLWKDIFRIYMDVQVVTKKFEVLLSEPDLILSEPDLASDVTISDEENLWSILNLLLNLCRRKQLVNGSAGGLLERIVELRQELNGFCSEKLKVEMMNVTA